MCVFLKKTFDLNDLWPTYLACWFISTLCRSCLEIKVSRSKFIDTAWKELHYNIMYFGFLVVSSPVGAVPNNCDEHICLFVHRWRYLQNHTCDLYQFFCACCLWPWLSPPTGWWNREWNSSFGSFLPHWLYTVIQHSIWDPYKNSWTDRDAIWDDDSDRL